MVHKWNVAIQHQLPADMALEVGYVGNHSAHQLYQPDPNACPNVPTTNSNLTCEDFRPVPYIGGVSGTATFGIGNYQGLTTKLEKRYSAGLQFVASYTYGHALADTGTTLSGSAGFYQRDNTNIRTSYSSAAWDIRHNFTLGFNYDIPFGRGKQYGSNMNAVLNALAGNWHLNGIATFHTGNPFTLRANGCIGVWAGCSPDLVSGTDANAAPSGGRRPAEWFNTANVTAPTPLTEGSLGLQTNYSPPTRSVDLSIFKDFPFTERWRLQFRAESFNLANTPQFDTPDNTLGNSTFGQVTATQVGTERHIQFALRLLF
jgi:hypothetical protein